MTSKTSTSSNKQTMTTNTKTTNKMTKEQRQMLKEERLNLEAFILGAVSALMGCEPDENQKLRDKLDWAVERHMEVEQLLGCDE